MALQRREVRRLVPGVVLACVFLVLVCLAAFIVQGRNDRAALHRATAALIAERATCRIQANGLKANRALVAAIGDIGNLLTNGLASGLPRARTGGAVDAKTLALLESLAVNASTYAQVERQNPPTRTC